jgi:wyosine [tRNA(Phe)-imidazoG37] synthetase (radical SAM superfamily)
VTEIAFRHVFGPVPSRRLGRSLGVDLVPFKTCTYDCVYCQLGRTTEKTVERREYVPTTAVLEEIEKKLEAGIDADFITLSGSGEPTLHAGCGEIIRGIKRLTQTPVAVLTNGSLLSDPEVREELMAADLLVPSLDAGDEKAFERVNRPHPAIRFETLVAGLVSARQAFRGRYWLEVFLLKGSTDTDTQIARIADHLRRIDPDRVHLNTVARPPAEDAAIAVAEAEMRRLAEAFGDTAEVVADFVDVHRDSRFTAGRKEVAALVRRRPCTVADVAASLRMHRNEALKHLDALVTDGAVQYETLGEQRFFVCASR